VAAMALHLAAMLALNSAIAYIAFLLSEKIVP
jgi:hypothetical protein